MQLLTTRNVDIDLFFSNIYFIMLNRKRDNIIMANSTSDINVNVDTKIKDEATIILKGLGLNMNTFINMALTQVVKKNGVPFDIVNPTADKEMLEVLEEIKAMNSNSEKYSRYSNREDLKKALMSND